MTGHLWEFDHPYHCNDGNYFDGDCVLHYPSWSEFLAAEGNRDDDLNLVFRWDWRAANTDWNSTAGDQLCVYWMGQRKGIFRVTITQVDKQDEPAVRAWLRARFEHLLTLWAPISGDGDRHELPEPNDVVESPPDNERMGQCECCDSEDVPTSKYDRVHFAGGKERTVWMCNVCACTTISSAYQYPNQTADSRLYQTIGYVTNEILKAIREKDDDGD